MKTIIKIIVLSSLFLLMLNGTVAYAQINPEKHNTYNYAIGARLGASPGLSVKHFITQKTAFEMLIQAPRFYRGTVLTGLLEYHQQAFDLPRMHVFYGLGGHVGAYRGNSYRNRVGDIYKRNVVTIGLDGIVGLEYHFPEIPITMGIDIKPYFDVFNPGFGFFDGAITVRYAIE